MKKTAFAHKGYAGIITAILLTAPVLFAGKAWCGEALEQARLLFYEGNASYSREDFEEAAAEYEEALASGFESGPLYYNLGNACFKQGLLGKAILNYLRGRRLMPRDADLRSNLRYARSLIKGGAVRHRRRWLARWISGPADSFTLDGIARFTAVLYLLLALLTVVFIAKRSSRKALAYVLISGTVLLTLCLSVFSAGFYETAAQKKAVVISGRTDSKFEPFDEATTFFTLYEGETVAVLASKTDWVKIRRADGKQGWVRGSDIEGL